MTKAAPQSREPGQLGPQDMSHIAPQSPTGPWMVTPEVGGFPDMTHVPLLPTLPLLILLPIHFNKWMEDLLRMFAGWETGKDGTDTQYLPTLE